MYVHKCNVGLALLFQVLHPFSLSPLNENFCRHFWYGKDKGEVVGFKRGPSAMVKVFGKGGIRERW